MVRIAAGVWWLCGTVLDILWNVAPGVTGHFLTTITVRHYIKERVSHSKLPECLKVRGGREWNPTSRFRCSWIYEGCLHVALSPWNVAPKRLLNVSSCLVQREKDTEKKRSSPGRPGASGHTGLLFGPRALRFCSHLNGWTFLPNSWQDELFSSLTPAPNVSEAITDLLFLEGALPGLCPVPSSCAFPSENVFPS